MVRSRRILSASRPREKLVEALQDFAELFAGDVLEHLHTRPRAASALSPDEDVDAVYDLVADLHLAALQPHVGGVVIAAGCRAAGPPNCERPYLAEPALEVWRGFHGASLRIDEGEVAEVGAGAGRQPALNFRRVVGQLFEQRLLEQRPQACVGNVGNKHVLARRQAHFTATVDVPKPRQLTKLITRHAPDRRLESHGVEPRWTLAEHADVVAGRRRARIAAGRRERALKAQLQFLARTLGAPLFDQESQACLRARLTRPVVSKQQRDRG